jgi:hypothetical protein
MTGYDEEAADHFDEGFVGGTEWIGTTECAALLRSFGNTLLSLSPLLP